MNTEERLQKILSTLRDRYPDVEGTALEFSDPLQLLIATVLSAQCTDERVNAVTERLFKKYKTAEDYANAVPEELQAIIVSTGFYRRKARFIKRTARKLVEEYDSKVPQTVDEMTKLPGVARKTANIVLSNAFGVNQGIAVDTHVKRVSQRLGLTDRKTRDAIEKSLMEVCPESQWFDLTNLLIAHGRSICEARHPKCEECSVSEYCPSAFTFD